MTVELLEYTPNPETNIANAARICYDSKPKDLDGERKFIKALIKAGHTATIEHSSCTFRFSGVSRCLTHQLVRHRLFSFCQRSQRYVKEDDFEYVVPESIKNDETAKKDYADLMSRINSLYEDFLKRGIKAEDARYILPNACASQIVVSGNFREWRNFLDLRLEQHAQKEIRDLANLVLDELMKIAPSVFEDLREKYRGNC